jgi:hypothetical protein
LAPIRELGFKVYDDTKNLFANQIENDDFKGLLRAVFAHTIMIYLRDYLQKGK